jgi:2-phospho-L-lactate guanylyltransferase
MALDTVAALLSCPRVIELLIVTHDDAVRTDFEPWGCTIVDDRAAGDLNAAIKIGAARRPVAPCIVVLGDLPTLTPTDVAMVLNRCEGPPHFVSDARGTGTTMWLTTQGTVHTHFGERSRSRHIESGAREMRPRVDDDPLAWARLHRDVDDVVDLVDALRLGAGAFTSELIGQDRGAGHAARPLLEKP